MKFLLLAASILLGTLGQILMKWGMEAPKPILANAGPLLRTFSSWPVLAGLFSYGLSSLFWLMTLKRMALSTAYPMVSLSYILVMAAAGSCFKKR